MGQLCRDGAVQGISSRSWSMYFSSVYDDSKSISSLSDPLVDTSSFHRSAELKQLYKPVFITDGVEVVGVTRKTCQVCGISTRRDPGKWIYCRWDAQVLSAGMWEPRLFSCILLARGCLSVGNEIHWSLLQQNPSCLNSWPHFEPNIFRVTPWMGKLSCQERNRTEW